MKKWDFFFLIVFAFVSLAIGHQTIAQDKKTEGDNSPIVETIYGDVKIIYPDIPHEALKTIIRKAIDESSQPTLLTIIKNLSEADKAKSQTIKEQYKIIEKGTQTSAALQAQIKQQVKAFQELSEELATRDNEDKITQDAKALMDAGKLEEAEKVLEEDALRFNKKAAYRNYETAQAKALNLKYQEATQWYAAAAILPPKNFKYLNAYGLNLYTLGMYDFAIENFQQALRIRNLSRTDSATAFNNLGLAWYSKGEYDRAINFYEKALAIDTVVHGNKHPDVAIQYNNLGSAWDSKGQYDRAINFYEKALAIDTVVHGNKHPDVAIQYNNLGSAWRSKGQYDRAINFNEKALAIDTVAYGNKHPDVAIDYNNMGFAWSLKGQYDRAINFYEKALAIDTIVYGNKHPMTAIRYNNLGSAWKSKGQYDRAINFYEKALAIDTMVHGNKHPSVAIRYNNLGSAWNSKGEYDRAINFYEKALAIDTVVHGNKHPMIAIQYNNLGFTWNLKRQYDRAITFHEKALAIDTVVHGSKHPNVAIDYNNLGGAWNSKGEYDRAINFYEKALAIDTIVYGNKHPKVGIRYNNLGCAWGSKGEYDRAVNFYEKAQCILIKFDADHPDVRTVNNNIARTHNTVGLVFYQSQAYESALIQFNNAIQHAESADSEDFLVTCYNNAGGALRHLGKYEEALKVLKKGILLAQKLDLQVQSQSQTLPDSMQRHQNIEVCKQNTYILHLMYLHQAYSLQGLDRKKEAQALFKYLKEYAIKNDDKMMLHELE